ncbi:MAG: F0F1 ATP synthase subunit A [Propionibacteriaceae bacterium]|jgi:F-type H+-transporting ATPase subunit a|nr:F0F1 ATP synthase subunit A [Propionibacteriaceae bacterium]
MAYGPSGLTVLETEVPTFGVSAFDSRPLFPSERWQECHPHEGLAPQICSTSEYATWTDIWITNHILQAVIAAILVIGFWLIVSHKPQVVPSKRQWIGEYVYTMIRNGVAREIIGDNYHKYVPWLVAMFTFIIVNNLFGSFFLFMFPTFSKVGFVWGFAIITWILYNAVGIKKWGFFPYVKKMIVPHGVPGPILILVTPLEFLSNFIIRPITLALRLFANLFAGHLLVMIFVVGGTYLLTQIKDNIIYNVAGGFSLLISFGIFALELLVAYLQAYIFVVLTAQYVSSAQEEAH